MGKQLRQPTKLWRSCSEGFKTICFTTFGVSLVALCWVFFMIPHHLYSHFSDGIHQLRFRLGGLLQRRI